MKVNEDDIPKQNWGSIFKGDIDAGQISSVAQSCPTLCDLMDCSTPGFPILYYLPELLKHPTMSFSVILFSSCLQSFLASGSFQMSQFVPSGGQSIGVSASASVLPMKISGLISFSMDWLDLLALSRVFSNTTVQKHQFLTLSFLCSPTNTSIMTIGKTIALTRWTFVGKVMSLLFNMLSGLVISFLSRSECLLIS